MKNAQIAADVFAVLDAEPLAELKAVPLRTTVADLAGLSLVPWFCDSSVQWAFRLTLPGTKLKKTLLEKVNDSYIAATDKGALLIGVPGDGIEPSTFTLFPLAEALGRVAAPGMVLEMATANMGVVKRDVQVKAETATRHGNQRYVGTVGEGGAWAISQTTPGLDASVLEAALECGRKVATNGPWKVRDAQEAREILLLWMGSPEANISPAAVRRFVKLEKGEFRVPDPGMARKLCGLGLGFFRHRFPDGPFRWPAPGPSRHAPEQLQEIARLVAG